MASHGFAPLGRRLFAEFVGTGLLVTVVIVPSLCALTAPAAMLGLG